MEQWCIFERMFACHSLMKIHVEFELNWRDMKNSLLAAIIG